MSTLERVHTPDRPGRFSIIFVHGLTGEAKGTWTNDRGELWPKWVGEATGCDTWVYGYDAPLSAWAGQAMPLPLQADNLLDRLETKPELRDRPLILVGHSLGGLVVKTVIVNGATHDDKRFERVVDRIRGVVFVAVPHSGSSLADTATAASALVFPNSTVRDMRSHDHHLKSLSDGFLAQKRRRTFAVRTFAETKRTPLRRWWGLRRVAATVVSTDHADPHVPGEKLVPISADHNDICKPAGRDAQIHESLTAFIADLGSRVASTTWMPKLDLPRAAGREAARFTYLAGKVECLGREKEFARLRAFLDDPAPFSWWLVVGPGGVGKTRLAYEFCLRLGDDWDKGFLIADRTRGETDAAARAALVDKWAAWRPDRPTLIVVDYVAQRAAFLGELIARLAARDATGSPVRLLLLEREATGRWADEFKRPDTAGRVRVDGALHAEPLALASPDDDSLWTIISKMSEGRATNRADALAALRHADPRARPLFAGFLGDAIKRAGHPRRWSRDELLTDVLDHCRARHWEPAGVTEADQALLCLATLTGGASGDWLEADVAATVPDPLPDPGDGELFRRYRVMADAEPTIVRGRAIYPPLLPDVLGEYFVLGRLHPNPTLSVAGRERLATWLTAAWRLNPRGTAVVLDRVSEDFLGDPRADPLFEIPPPADAPGANLFWCVVRVNQGVRLLDAGRGDEALVAYDDVETRFGAAKELPFREPVAKALYNKGVALGTFGRSDEAVRVYEAVESRFGAAAELPLREQVAKALYNKGVDLRTLGRLEDAIAAFGAVESRFGTATELPLREVVATTLFRNGVDLGTLGRLNDAVAVYEAVEARFGAATELPLREWVAKALYNKGVDLRTLGRLEDAVAAFGAVESRFGTATELSLLEPAAAALYNKGVDLGTLGRFDDAVAAFGMIESRFGAATELPLREWVARALFDKGFVLGTLGRWDEAVGAYEAVETRFSGAMELPLRERVAMALNNKGVALGTLGRWDETIRAYEAVETRFGAAKELPLREQVAGALVNKGVALGTLGRWEDAVRAFEAVENRLGATTKLPLREQVAGALVNKSVALLELGRWNEALTALDAAVERYGGDSELREVVERARLLAARVRADDGGPEA